MVKTSISRWWHEMLWRSLSISASDCRLQHLRCTGGVHAYHFLSEKLGKGKLIEAFESYVSTTHSTASIAFMIDAVLEFPDKAWKKSAVESPDAKVPGRDVKKITFPKCLMSWTSSSSSSWSSHWGFLLQHLRSCIWIAGAQLLILCETHSSRLAWLIRPMTWPRA